MIIALTQMDIIWKDKAANLKKGEELTRRAAEAGADMIVFPEMSFTGYSRHLDKIGEDLATSETVKKMLEISEKYQIAIVFGYAQNPAAGAEKGKNRLVVAESGKILTQYDKIHPFTYGQESESYQGGDHIAICNVNGADCSFYICYDLRFPEIFQVCSSYCQLMVVIANWPVERIGQWEALLRGRAVENQCYTVGVNRVGEGGGICYVPSSMGFDPYGERLPEQTCQDQELLLVTVDEAGVGEYRKEFPLLQDRRQDLYIKLYHDDKVTNGVFISYNNESASGFSK